MSDSTDRPSHYKIDTASVDVDVDDEWGWDHLSLFTIGLFHLYPEGGSLRMGTGETVPVSYLSMRARMLFLQALYRLVPSSTTTLLTEEAYGLMDAYADASREWRAYAREHGIDGSFASENALTFPPCEEAGGKVVDHILEWQQRYRLPHDWRFNPPDSWVSRAANFTLTAAKRLRDLTGDVYDGPLVVRDVARASVHDGRPSEQETVDDIRAIAARKAFTFTPPHKLVNVPLYPDDLKHPSYETDDGDVMEDEGDFGHFDPRTETVDVAVSRLLPVLESRLRRHLETIVEEDRTLNGALEPMTFRKQTAFEWLVRFQVLGESRRDISKSIADARLERDPEWEQHYRPDFYTSHVGKEIRKVADLIGLTLRDA